MTSRVVTVSQIVILLIFAIESRKVQVGQSLFALSRKIDRIRLVLF